MNISIEKKKTEAIERMNLLGIFPETIRQFAKDGYVSISEPPMGAFFWCEGAELEQVREFEKDHNALVYVIVRSYTEIGKLDAYLFVGDYLEEWQQDRDMIEDGLSFAYVVNQSAPDLSEFGDIGIAKTVAAGLRRTW